MLTRTCERDVCPVEFKTYSKTRRFCSKSCALRSRPRETRLLGTRAASKARTEKFTRQLDAKLHDQFGPLNEREVALVAAIWRAAYDRGYCAAMTPIRRGAAA